LTDVLTNAKNINTYDRLAPFLVSAINKINPQSTVAHCPVHLSNIQITLTNLNCGCHVSKVVEAMEKCDGVAFVYVPSNVKPYKGTLLLDQAKTSLKDVLAATTQRVKEVYAGAKVP